MEEKVRLGIASCLLGKKVRYDGGHKRDPFLIETLGRWVEYVPVCPEQECGLGVPREAMRLQGNLSSPRLVTVRTGVDHTDRMMKWGGKRLKELEIEDLCGYIFKSKSPWSGLHKIRVYRENGMSGRQGVGIWASMFTRYFPQLPVEDEGRLNDPQLRENFIERVFVMKRWRKLTECGKKLGTLVEFHTRHKILIMSHSVKAYRRMGKLVAAGKNIPDGVIYEKYLEELTAALKLNATVNKHRNVLQHLMGYFKRDINTGEKKELLDQIVAFASGLIPLIVPVTLINHYIRKYDQKYLAGQYYLNPHPLELKLRNHV